ncbi:hypothetical protein LCGC14_1770930 [marine sediment metagenome]|uniref:Uncharacterized protein n=1 Tax=marine sediment metagenome TaxID=412755 RepID=A0A0F9HKV7_9ZZZZ
MRGTPFTKLYPGALQKLWDRYDRLPAEYREMVANDLNGNSTETLEAAEELAREAGLLPPLPEEEGLSKKELRAQRDRERTEAAKDRSRIAYKLSPGPYVLKENPRPEERVAVTVIEKSDPRFKSEHNS